jgi:hypothetical protein
MNYLVSQSLKGALLFSDWVEDDNRGVFSYGAGLCHLIVL